MRTNKKAKAIKAFKETILDFLRKNNEENKMPLGIVLSNCGEPKIKIKEVFPSYKEEATGEFDWPKFFDENMPDFEVRRNEKWTNGKTSDILLYKGENTKAIESNNEAQQVIKSENSMEMTTNTSQDDLVQREEESTTSQKAINQIIKTLLEELNAGLFEKERSIRLTLLAILAGESTFMLGEPGTAKSLIARRMSEAFEDPSDNDVTKFFDYLMNQFSQPDELFGPVSIKELKNDKYIRKTEGYLPKAQFAFLDEIWKANPAIQNALLTILNEKIFRNGDKIEDVPLIGFMSASNELPEKGKGLEAIFDRFLVRILERPIEDPQKFFNMITTGRSNNISVSQRLTKAMIDEIQEGAERVNLSGECFAIIAYVRKSLAQKNEEVNREENEKYMISDRRWKKIVNLMRVSAYCSNRMETDLMDASLIADCIWSTESQEEETKQIVREAIENYGIKANSNLSGFERALKFFEEEVNQKFFEEKTEGGGFICYKDEGLDYYKIKGCNMYISNTPAAYNRYYCKDNGLKTTINGRWVESVFESYSKGRLEAETSPVKKKLVIKESLAKDEEVWQEYVDKFNEKRYKKLREAFGYGFDYVKKRLQDSTQKYENDLFADAEYYLPVLQAELAKLEHDSLILIKKLEAQKERYEVHR